MAETLRSGGMEFEAEWITCRAAASFRAGEAVVHVESVGYTDPLGFFVDRELVQPPELPVTEVDGQVKVILVERNGGTSIVSVPGEPLSFGPKIVISNEQFIT